MDRLDWLRVFVRVAELGSFTRAAESLGMQKGTASATVQQLENVLGARLLHRTTRRVELTQDGRACYERARDLLSEADELGALFQQSPQRLGGRLRVDMSVGLAQNHVIPRLPEFTNPHPDLTVEISATDRRVDLLREGFDVNNICVMASELEQICTAYCANMYGDTCVDANCPGLTAAQKEMRAFNEETCLNGNPMFQAPLGLSCVERLAGTTDIAQMENTLAREAAGLGCDSSTVRLRQSFGQFILTAEGATVGGFSEQCGAKPDPDINKSCTTDADCNTGLISGSCQMVNGQGFCGLGACQAPISDMQRQQIISQMSGLIASGEEAGCGENTYCLVQAQGQGLASGCEEACQTNSDCRFGVSGADDSGFACGLGSLVTSGNETLRVGFCEPACATDADCPAVMVNGMPLERLCGNTRVCEETCVVTDQMACRTTQGTQYATCTVSTNDAEKASCHNATLQPLTPPM